MDIASRGPARGERPAEELARRLDRPMGALGLLFLLVLTGQLLATSPGWSQAFTVLGWTFWAAFAAEGAFARCLEVVLALYSVVVFAALAGSLGAFFLRGAPDEAAPATTPSPTDRSRTCGSTAGTT